MASLKMLCLVIALCCVSVPGPQSGDEALDALGDLAEYSRRAERQIDKAQELSDLGRTAAARAAWDSARGVLAAMAQAVRDADAAIATQPEVPFGAGMRRFIAAENASRGYSIVKVRVLTIEEYWRDVEDEAEARRRRDIMPGFDASVEVLEIHTVGRYLFGPRRLDLFVGRIIRVYGGGTLPAFTPENAVRMEDLDVGGVFWVAIGPPVAPRLPQVFMSCGKSGLGFAEAATRE